MSDERYEVLTADEMRRKYGLVASNRPVIRLDPAKVPEKLRHLIPYAELWGVGDDLMRDDIVRTAPAEALADLKRIVLENEDLIDEWLAGPAADVPDPSDEYLAYSAMRIAADSI